MMIMENSLAQQLEELRVDEGHGMPDVMDPIPQNALPNDPPWLNPGPSLFLFPLLKGARRRVPKLSALCNAP